MRALTAAFAALFLLSCQSENPAAIEPAEVAPILDTPDAVDVHSYAKPLEARVTHVALDLNLDFQARRIGGTATLDIMAKPGAKEVILDDKGLEIEAVTDEAGNPLPYRVGAHDEKKGAPLTIQMGDKRKIVIRYKSAPDAGALQWLTPEQTAGKKYPFLLSQGQSIENRSVDPDPGQPRHPPDLDRAGHRAGAAQGGHVGRPADAGRRGRPAKAAGPTDSPWTKPVAPYLIAIAAGDLAFRELGPRTGVWAEPVTLDKAAAELADTEKMVDAAERLYGPYRWGRYDVIVLPPSFPYGGMENPTLTFLTPTFIAGDKSLVGLVAHELAHSWSGNLVTNATWADGWLNEGFTSYFENRIMEAIYGPRRAQQEAALSFDDMMEALKEEGMNAPVTRLHLAPAEAMPDGGATGIVYDKGAIFLRTIEKIVGRERWDAYLRSYFDRHAFQPMTSARFLADLRAELVRGDAELEKRLMLDQWVYQPGLPANVARPDPAAFAAVDQAVAAFSAGGTAPAAFGGWTTAEKLRFLNSLPRKLPGARLGELDNRLRLNEAGNNEVLFAWLELAVANRYDPAVPALERFLTVQGRRKFVRPLITALAEDAAMGPADRGPRSMPKQGRPITR